MPSRKQRKSRSTIEKVNKLKASKAKHSGLESITFKGICDHCGGESTEEQSKSNWSDSGPPDGYYEKFPRTCFSNWLKGQSFNEPHEANCEAIFAQWLEQGITRESYKKLSSRVLLPYRLDDHIKWKINGWKINHFLIPDMTQCFHCEEFFTPHIFVRTLGGLGRKFPYLVPIELFKQLVLVQRGKSQRLGKRYLYGNHPCLWVNMMHHFPSYKVALHAFKKYKEN